MRKIAERASVAASRKALERRQSEAEWQQTVMATLQLGGWVCFHINASIVRASPDGIRRYATAVTPQGRGFPDVIALRGPRLVLIELKTERGVVSREQSAWHQRLRLVPGVEVYVLRPSDAIRLTEIAA